MCVLESPKRVSDALDFLTCHKKEIFQNGRKRHALHAELNYYAFSAIIVLLIINFHTQNNVKLGCCPTNAC
jgi:hypothetical protein